MENLLGKLYVRDMCSNNPTRTGPGEPGLCHHRGKRADSQVLADVEPTLLARRHNLLCGGLLPHRVVDPSTQRGVKVGREGGEKPEETRPIQEVLCGCCRVPLLYKDSHPCDWRDSDV